MKNPTVLLAALFCLTIGVFPAHATVEYTTTGTEVDYYDPSDPSLGYPDQEATFDGNISKTDLVEANSSSLSGSVEYSDSSHVLYPGGIDDGLATSTYDPGQQSGFGPHDAYLITSQTVTFNLNSAYNIAKIQVISGYSGSFSNQNFSVSFETTSSNGMFIPLDGPFTKNGVTDTGDGSSFSNDGYFQAAETEITDSTGLIATDVTGIRFNFAGGVIIRELDVFAPEPQAWAMLLVGLVALVGFTRFRRKA